MSKVIQKKAQKFRLWSKIFIVATVIALGIGGYIGYDGYKKMLNYKSLLTNVLQYQQTLSNDKLDIDETYQNARKAFIAEQKEIAEKIDAVFPIESHVTRLTRLLDDFFIKNNTPSDPLFVSSLSFNDSAVLAADDFATIDFSLSIESSKDNFMNVLDFFQSSGALNERPYRLMEIKSISLSLPDKTTFISNEGEDKITYTIEAVAYFKKPVSESEE